MASVALAGPPRVNDKLQTLLPTVYKSGTLGVPVELAMIPVSVCNISSRLPSHVGHGMG
jgi:hypothetical protein